MIKLWYYFGIIGYASLFAWMVAGAVMFRNLRGPDRTKRFWQAFAIAALGLLLANWNSSNIFAIQPDMSDQLKAQEERKERMEQHAAGLAAAEAEGGDTASGGTSQVETVSSTNVAESASGTNNVPLYRRGGKVERAEGKKIEDKMLEKAAEVTREDQIATRKMKPLDVWWANRYNVMNLFFARLTLWMTLIAAVADYLLRFNSTRNVYCPLPLASVPFVGPVVDSFCPKNLSVQVRQGGKDAVRSYLERAFQKGEGFIYFGAESPWPRTNGESTGTRPGRYLARVTPDSDQLSLARLHIRDIRPWLLALSIKGLREVHPERVTLAESALNNLVPHDADLWQRPILHFPARSGDIHTNFALESTWFGRYSLVVGDADLAGQWLDDLRRFLDTRVQVLARARRTVNVVWDLDRPIPEATLKDLLFLCGETNYKFLLIGEHALSAEMEARFEERLDELSVAVDSNDEGFKYGSG